MRIHTLKENSVTNLLKRSRFARLEYFPAGVCNKSVVADVNADAAIEKSPPHSPYRSISNGRSLDPSCHFNSRKKEKG
jgi:hypothetical protein